MQKFLVLINKSLIAIITLTSCAMEPEYSKSAHKERPTQNMVVLLRQRELGLLPMPLSKSEDAYAHAARAITASIVQLARDYIPRDELFSLRDSLSEEDRKAILTQLTMQTESLMVCVAKDISLLDTSLNTCVRISENLSVLVKSMIMWHFIDSDLLPEGARMQTLIQLLKRALDSSEPTRILNEDMRKPRKTMFIPWSGYLKLKVSLEKYPALGDILDALTAAEWRRHVNRHPLWAPGTNDSKTFEFHETV